MSQRRTEMHSGESRIGLGRPDFSAGVRTYELSKFIYRQIYILGRGGVTWPFKRRSNTPTVLFESVSAKNPKVSWNLSLRQIFQRNSVHSVSQHQGDNFITHSTQNSSVCAGLVWFASYEKQERRIFCWVCFLIWERFFSCADKHSMLGSW